MFNGLFTQACQPCSGLADRLADTVTVSVPQPPSTEELPRLLRHEAEAKRSLKLDEKRTALIYEEEEEKQEFQRQEDFAEHDHLQPVQEEEEEQVDEDEAKDTEQEDQGQNSELEERLREAEAEAKRLEEVKQQEKAEQAQQRRLEVQRQQQDSRKQAKLRAFLSSSGFKSVNEKKKTGFFSTGFTYPLHVAAEKNDAKAVEALLWAGADPTRRNSKGSTPETVASTKKSEDVVKLLASLK